MSPTIKVFFQFILYLTLQFNYLSRDNIKKKKSKEMKKEKRKEKEMRGTLHFHILIN